ncbi:hypothetical protein D3C77_724610 [compost metagenome]
MMVRVTIEYLGRLLSLEDYFSSCLRSQVQRHMLRLQLYTTGKINGRLRIPKAHATKAWVILKKFSAIIEPF